MSNLYYPSIRGLQYPVKKTPTYNNLIQPSKSGVEVAVAMMQNPIWIFELGYEYIEDGYLPQQSGFGCSDFHALVGFFMARKGTFDDFLFVDTTDYIQLAAPLPLVQDLNGFFYSPLQRTLRRRHLRWHRRHHRPAASWLSATASHWWTRASGAESLP